MRRLLALALLLLALLHDGAPLPAGWAAEGADGEGEGEGPVAADAPMEEKEKAALYAAIEGFVGRGWNGSGLFPDPCGQSPIQGVACDLFNGVWYPTVISIGPVLDNSLQCSPDARMSSQLFDLRQLKSLSLYECFPASNPTAIPAAGWERLAGSLETLELRTNAGLGGAIPAALGRLASLRSLVLVESNLTGAVPAELGALLKLRRLVLSGNGLSGPIPAALGNDRRRRRRLDELLILDVSRNYLTGSLPSSLGGLRALLKMDLSNNLLQGRIPPELAGLQSLTLLDLRNNSFAGGLPEFVQGMASLQDLLLSNNPLLGGSLMRSGWEKLASLATLDLSNLGLVGTIPESMAALPRLRFLALDHNHLSGDVPAKLAALPSIAAMYLNGNNLTGELQFSPGFYQRLGSRFASWDNPGLCYNSDAAATGGDGARAPSGVAACKDAQEPGASGSGKSDGRKPEASSSLLASSSSSSPAAAAEITIGIRCLLLVQAMVVAMATLFF